MCARLQALPRPPDRAVPCRGAARAVTRARAGKGAHLHDRALLERKLVLRRGVEVVQCLGLHDEPRSGHTCTNQARRDQVRTCARHRPREPQPSALPQQKNARPASCFPPRQQRLPISRARVSCARLVSNVRVASAARACAIGGRAGVCNSLVPRTGGPSGRHRRRSYTKPAREQQRR